MANAVDITLIANAGIYLQWNTIGILVDGLYNENGHPFSMVTESDMERMRQGQSPFEHLDYLLFSHEHPDHFTPDCVLKHIKQRPVQGLLLPDESTASPRFSHLLDHVRNQNIPHHTFGLEPGQTKITTLTGDLTITAIGTRHMGPQYQDVRNDCYLISMGGMHILFTGDADHVAEYYEEALSTVMLDAVFVNPIFYHNPKGQEIINTIFRPRHTIIYHMPFPEDDTLHFTYMVGRDTEKYKNPRIRTHVLAQEKQTIRIYGLS